MLKLPRFELIQPQNIEEAVAALAGGGVDQEVVVIAGGTDLLVRMKQRSLQAKALVDVCALENLHALVTGTGDLRIGSATRLAVLSQAEAVRGKYPVLAKAARLVGAAQHQVMGTVGGNICADNRCLYFNQNEWWRAARGVCLKTGGEICHINRKADRCYSVCTSDLAPVLVALDAKIVICGVAGEYTVQAEDFFTGDGLKPNILTKGDIVTQLILPGANAAAWGGFVKLRPRKAIDYAGISAAVSLSICENQIRDARVVLGAVSQGPLRVGAAETVLRGASISAPEVQDIAAAFNLGQTSSCPDWLNQAGEESHRAANPMRNTVWRASYRRKMTRVAVQRAIIDALACGYGCGSNA